ncbi:STE3-domain-containing protein [Peniophora sp. CONT]|nr:STE3-domain-containing protein [Peniophora sp. CONT]
MLLAAAAKVAYTFYRHNKDVNRFLQSNGSISRTSYMRVLILASIDILLTLPLGIMKLVLSIIPDLQGPIDPMPFYGGWKNLHTTFWSPVSFSYEQISVEVVELYVSNWTDPVLAFVIFALFGLTPDARASYWSAITIVGGWFGWRPTPSEQDIPVLESMQFGPRREEPDSASLDAEMGMWVD